VTSRNRVALLVSAVPIVVTAGCGVDATPRRPAVRGEDTAITELDTRDD
jgi:hypothetical protein